MSVDEFSGGSLSDEGLQRAHTHILMQLLHRSQKIMQTIEVAFYLELFSAHDAYKI